MERIIPQATAEPHRRSKMYEKTTPLCSGMVERIIPQATAEPNRKGKMYEKTPPLCSGMGRSG